MTYRVDYRERVALTESEHDTVISAIETFVDGNPERRFPFYQRHREQGETEIHIIITGLTYDQIASMQDAVETAIKNNNIPGDWPNPTEYAKINNEQ